MRCYSLGCCWALYKPGRVGGRRDRLFPALGGSPPALCPAGLRLQELALRKRFDFQWNLCCHGFDPWGPWIDRRVRGAGDLTDGGESDRVRAGGERGNRVKSKGRLLGLVRAWGGGPGEPLF